MLNLRLLIEEQWYMHYQWIYAKYILWYILHLRKYYGHKSFT